MPVMTPGDLMKFLGEHFPQVAHLNLGIEHLDDTSIRVRLLADERHLRPMRKPEPADLLGEGRLMKLGRSLAVGDFTIWSEGRTDPVAHATVTYSIPPRSTAAVK